MPKRRKPMSLCVTDRVAHLHPELMPQATTQIPLDHPDWDVDFKRTPLPPEHDYHSLPPPLQSVAKWYTNVGLYFSGNMLTDMAWALVPTEERDQHTRAAFQTNNTPGSRQLVVSFDQKTDLLTLGIHSTESNLIIVVGAECTVTQPLCSSSGSIGTLICTHKFQAVSNDAAGLIEVTCKSASINFKIDKPADLQGPLSLIDPSDLGQTPTRSPSTPGRFPNVTKMAFVKLWKKASLYDPNGVRTSPVRSPVSAEIYVNSMRQKPLIYLPPQKSVQARNEAWFIGLMSILLFPVPALLCGVTWLGLGLTLTPMVFGLSMAAGVAISVFASISISLYAMQKRKKLKQATKIASSKRLRPDLSQFMHRGSRLLSTIAFFLYTASFSLSLVLLSSTLQLQTLPILATGLSFVIAISVIVGLLTYAVSSYDARQITQAAPLLKVCVNKAATLRSAMVKPGSMSQRNIRVKFEDGNTPGIEVKSSQALP